MLKETSAYVGRQSVLSIENFHNYTFDSIPVLSLSFHLFYNYANTSLLYTAIFHGCKNLNFHLTFFFIFLIFAQNKDCGYTLEPPL